MQLDSHYLAYLAFCIASWAWSNMHGLFLYRHNSTQKISLVDEYSLVLNLFSLASDKINLNCKDRHNEHIASTCSVNSQQHNARRKSLKLSLFHRPQGSTDWQFRRHCITSRRDCFRGERGRSDWLKDTEHLLIWPSPWVQHYMSFSARTVLPRH